MNDRTLQPVFEASGGDPSSDRILLISDQFPPAQSAGALRWQKLSRFAANRGWILDVITRDPALLDARDDSRLAELPAGTRVYGFVPGDLLLDRAETWLSHAYRAVRRGGHQASRGLEGGEMEREKAPRAAGGGSLSPEKMRWDPASLRFWMRSYWSWLDHRRQLAWARSIEAVGVRILDRSRHRAVISCGPWHLCNHEAARRLSRRARLPFIMDLRDPWSLERRIAETIASPVWFALARHHESRAVRDAALVIVNAEPVERAMAVRYPGAAKRIVTVTNGYDDEAIPMTRHGSCFTIAYAGGIYLDRDPRPLFQAAARAIAVLGLTPESFRIEFIGNVDDYGGVPIALMAEQEGIASYVKTGPLRPRKEALEMLAGATMLLSLPQDSPWAIPSKIFEYMQFDAWMLVLAEADAPAALLLRDSGADVVSPSDVDGIVEVLKRRIEEFTRGERPRRLAHERKFSRRVQAERLMDELGRCISSGQSSSRQARESGTVAPAIAGVIGP